MGGLGLRPRFTDDGSLGDLFFVSVVGGDDFLGGRGLFDGDLSFFCGCCGVGLAGGSWSLSSLSLSESRRVLLSRRRLLRFVVEFVS